MNLKTLILSLLLAIMTPISAFAAEAASTRDELRSLASQLMSADAEERIAAEQRAVELARATFEELGERGAPWTEDDLDRLLGVQLVDPLRFVEDAEFRRRIASMLPEMIPCGVHPELRDLHLLELNRVRGLDFTLSEAVELAWGAVPRASRHRRVSSLPSELTFPHDAEGTIEASLFSLPSNFADAETALRFLAAVRTHDPERRLIVLTDEPLRGILDAADPGLVVLNQYGRLYSPWPRDTFVAGREAGRRPILLARPNLQKGREEDNYLARELIQNLPSDLDEQLGRPRWGLSPVPFHHGKFLTMPDTVWIDLHTLEVRTLQLLNGSSPTEYFGTVEEINRYITSVKSAAAEIESLLGRPVRFVHPLPVGGDLAQRQKLLKAIGGGADLDLDSLLTLLPDEERTAEALVADVSAGAEMLQTIRAEDLAAFAESFDLAGTTPDLLRRLRHAQDSARARQIDQYVDLVAEHLEDIGLRVRRLPLLVVPTELLATGTPYRHQDFLIGWNNVVLEGEDAEGFASGIESLDSHAQGVYREAGRTLTLFPPIYRSVILNGGYRCASNHLR